MQQWRQNNVSLLLLMSLVCEILDKNPIRTKLVLKLYKSNICCEMYFPFLRRQIPPCSTPSYTKTVICLFNDSNGIRLEMVIVLSGSQFTVTGKKPIWAPFKIMQINISPDLPVFFFFFFPTFPLFTTYQREEHFSLSWGSNERSLFFSESRQWRSLVQDWFMSHTLAGCYAWIIDC